MIDIISYMSLIAQLCSLPTQKLLMSKNLLFVVERVLNQMKKLQITPQEANCQISDLLDGKKPESNISKNLQESKDQIPSCHPEFISGSSPQKDQITFVSDDDSYSQPSQNSPKKDSISSMFDMYLSNDDSQSFNNKISNSSFNPFGNLDLNTNQNWNSTVNWTPPRTNWNTIAKLNDCVILYRTHSQSRAIEEAFLKAKLPYRLVSGTRFLDRKEIKDVMSILKFMSNGVDKISLSRFLPLVLDGVGPKTLERILGFLDDPDYPLAPKHQQMIVDLLTRLHNAWSQSTKLIDLCKELQIVSGYSRYLKKEYPIKDEYNDRIENIGEIYSLMLPFDQDESLDLNDKMSAFLAQISLMSMVDNTANDPDQPKINLMSLHQSKGLEYETVFLVGCEDGLLPHQNSFNERSDMEEEVRLAYVGVTRAKQNLFLTSAESRITFGQIKANPASRIFRPFLNKYCSRTK